MLAGVATYPQDLFGVVSAYKEKKKKKISAFIFFFCHKE